MHTSLTNTTKYTVCILIIYSYLKKYDNNKGKYKKKWYVMDVTIKTKSDTIQQMNN